MRIAVTGGICDGKSTVLEYGAEFGLQTISADAIVSELYASAPFKQKLADEFGSGVFQADSVDRSRLSSLVFTDADARRRLNKLVHPAIADLLLERSSSASIRYLVEVPLLVETALQGRFDAIWVVSAGQHEQQRRLVERLGGNAALAKRILASQLSTEVKEAFATAIVRTNQPRSAVKNYVSELVQRLA